MSEDLEPQSGTEEFVNLDANIDPDTIMALCRVYVETRMHPATVSLFNEVMSVDGNIEEALFRSVINEMVIQALVDQLARTSAPIPPFNI